MSGIKDLDHLTQAELAALLETTTRTIQRKTEMENLRHGSGQGCYYVWTEVRQWEKVLLSQVANAGEETSKSRKEAAEADLAEMKRDAMDGTLLGREDVRRTWAEALANMRAKLLNLPAKGAVRMEDGMTLAEREEILMGIVCEALEELSGRQGGEGGANA